MSKKVSNKKITLFFRLLWPVLLFLSLAVHFGFSFTVACRFLIKQLFGYSIYTGGLINYEEHLLIALALISMMLASAYQQNGVLIVRQVRKK